MSIDTRNDLNAEDFDDFFDYWEKKTGIRLVKPYERKERKVA